VGGFYDLNIGYSVFYSKSTPTLKFKCGGQVKPRTVLGKFLRTVLGFVFCDIIYTWEGKRLIKKTKIMKWILD